MLAVLLHEWLPGGNPWGNPCAAHALRAHYALLVWLFMGEKLAQASPTIPLGVPPSFTNFPDPPIAKVHMQNTTWQQPREHLVLQCACETLAYM